MDGTPRDTGARADRGWHDMDVRWLVTRDSVGADKSVFGVTIFPPGSKHDIHRHPNAEEVEYVIEGTGIAHLADDAVSLGPGEAVFVPRNEYHGFENTSDRPVVMAWCYAGAASLAEAGYVTRGDDAGA
jgi:quercetin dioxygenase-like cupin family protein